MIILIAKIIGATVLIVTLFINGENLKLYRKQLKNQQDNTDISRFESGYRLLQEKDDYVKIGGVYLLHEIAKQNDKLRKSIFDILCKYLREMSRCIHRFIPDTHSGNKRTVIPDEKGHLFRK